MSNPLFILTRPATASAELALRLPTSIETLIAPAFEIEPVEADIPDFEAAILTSQASVGFAPDGRGRRAWCVGAKTAEAAERRGYIPVSADGDADVLVETILRAQPQEILLHLRGEVSRGNIRARLNQAGLNCDERVIYRKSPSSPPRDIRAQLAHHDESFLLLFSAETVSIIQRWNLGWESTHCLCISDYVADQAKQLRPAQITVSSAPNLRSMIELAHRMIA
ncbi:MAG: uroporphyrinogen-III synthase [Pseudomonadota bacterium]